MTRKNKLRVVAASAIVCTLAFLIDAPELVPAAAIPALVWHTWRVYRVNAFGVALSAVTLEFVTAIAALVYHSQGSIFDLISFQILLCLALGTMLVSLLAFLVQAVLSRAQRRDNVIAAVLACLLPVATFFVLPRAAGSLAEWQLQREIARSGLPKIIADLNGISERLGRAPKDEAEAVHLLGRPIPRISRGTVFYSSSGGKHFSLGFGYDMGCYEYDSQKPEESWRVYL